MSSPPRSSGIICTDEQYARSLSSRSIHCLSRGASIGLSFAATSGLLSIVAVLFVFGIIFRNVARHIRHSPNRKWTVVQEPMDVLMLSLFSADILQALGTAMSLKWVHDGVVEVGGYCTAQGIVRQLGGAAVALSTLIIAIFTFVGLWWRKGISSIRIAKLTTGIVWSFVILTVIIGNAEHADKDSLFQAPTPYWCWIGNNYFSYRIWGEYAWFWTTMVVSIIAYTILFFWARGNIVVDEHSWWKVSAHRRSSQTGESDGVMNQAAILIAYPVTYTILILPLSVVRWIGFVQQEGGKDTHIASSATLTVGAIYGLSGFCNVILILTTRPNSILFGRQRNYLTGGLAPSPVMTTHTTIEATETARLGDRVELGRLPSRSSGGWDMGRS